MATKKVNQYHISVPDKRLEEIRAKLDSFNWEHVPDAGGWTAGVGISDLKRLVDYWKKSFSWRETEGRLNLLPNYIVDIDGETIHFIHFKANGLKPAVLLLHGWPGSFLEFRAVAQSLVQDGHDVIIPSLPGFAFSKPISGVIGPRRAAELMGKLMDTLGYDQYIVQGGDWGAHIASWMAYQRPNGLLGIHINMAGVYAEDSVPISSEEKEVFDRRAVILDWETGYNHQQETRPQTLGMALSDSPVGLAGWILEKFGNWSYLPKREDGSPDIWSKYNEQQLLENIMLYLVNSAEVTSTWIYLGKKLEGSSVFPAGTYINLPTGIAAFPDPVFIPTPRTFLNRIYNIVHWSDFDSGGHFAAMEEPELLLNDLRGFVKTL